MYSNSIECPRLDPSLPIVNSTCTTPGSATVGEVHIVWFMALRYPTTVVVPKVQVITAPSPTSAPSM
eukprot:3940228-Rhodomonas_salina.1